MSTARSEGSFSVFAPKEPGGLVSPKISFESHYSRSCARTGEHLFCLQATVALLPCDYGAEKDREHPPRAYNAVLCTLCYVWNSYSPSTIWLWYTA